MHGSDNETTNQPEPVGENRPVVRPFEVRDAAAVRALFITVNRLMAAPELREQFEAYIAFSLQEEIERIRSYYSERSGQFFVATDEDELVGMFGLECAGSNAAELRRMYVDPRSRRRGIGRMLLARAEDEARSAGCTHMILSTSELQPAALSLYRSAGYRQVRQDIETRATNKTLGGSIRRFHFERYFP